MNHEFIGSDTEMFIREYKEGLGEYQQKMPAVVEKYLDFTGVCFASGSLDRKTKHLIGLGISICVQDEYCIMYHTKEALHEGASEQDVLEVVGVAAAFGGGVAMSQGVTLVQECLQDLLH